MQSSSIYSTGQVLRAGLINVVEKAVERHGCSRSKLIQVLQEIQGELGYLPREVLEVLSTRVRLPLSEILSVASFYHQFRLEPTGDYIFQVCYGTACYLRRADEVFKALELATRTSRVTVEKVRCFGCCSLAPVVMVVNTRTGEKTIHGRLTPGEARRLLSRYLAQRA